MQLNLKRTIIFFDLETTGVDICKDRIVELSYIKVMADGKEHSFTQRFNPEIPIPAASTAVHGISDNDVKDCPTFKQLAQQIANDFKDCDFAGFNSNHFDIPMLAEEFARAGVDYDFSSCNKVDVQNIYHKLEPRTLSAAYKFYCGKNLEDAHSAQGDTRATYEVLKAQLDRYPQVLKNDVAFLADYSQHSRNVDLAGRIVMNDKNVEVFNFGKYKGQPVATVLHNDPGYYGWIMRGDFTLNTKQVLSRIRNGAKDNKNQK